MSLIDPFDAINKNDNDKLKLECNLSALNSLNEYNCTPLMIAVQCNKIKICEILIQKKVNCNFQNIFHETPLFVAINMCHIEIIKLLIPVTNCNIQNLNGYTALMCAVINEAIPIDILSELIKFTNCNITNNLKNNALMIAKNLNRNDVITLLVPHTSL